MFVFKVITLVIIATLGTSIQGQDQSKSKKSDDLETQASGKLQSFLKHSKEIVF
jgi:hypothetical protein